MKNDQLCVFLDPIGRTIFAEKILDRTTDTLLVVKNPVLVHIGQADAGKMSLQLIPIFFKEFLEDKTGDIIFTYQIANISIADPTTFDSKLYSNYQQMNSNLIVPDKKIDLFDETK